jgi:DNA-binding response OmpR family regulator
MKRVLSIGNCGFDNDAITSLLAKEFQAQTIAVDDWNAAERSLRDGDFALVLVNRKLDLDHGDGMAIIESIKSSEEFGKTPVMLLSNYPEYQQQAMALGAEAGFGKAELRSTETKTKLAKILG